MTVTAVTQVTVTAVTRLTVTAVTWGRDHERGEGDGVGLDTVVEQQLQHALRLVALATPRESADDHVVADGVWDETACAHLLEERRRLRYVTAFNGGITAL